MSATVVSADHLDLLLTAAERYEVLSNPTRAAFSLLSWRSGLPDRRWAAPARAQHLRGARRPGRD